MSHHFRRAGNTKSAAEAASKGDFSGAASDLITSYTNKLQSVKTSGVLRQALGMGALTGELTFSSF